MSLDISLAEFERSAINYLGTKDQDEEKYIADSIAEALINDDSKTLHGMKIILGEIRRMTENELPGIGRIWGYENVLTHYELFKARQANKLKS